ncbi:MAG: SOS response-associated peptidase family protein, partial [Gammaproteobacteria bacterium]
MAAALLRLPAASPRPSRYTPRMCGRFNLHDNPFLRQLLAELGVGPLPGDHLNIAPTEAVPVVFEEEGERRLHVMRWWLVPSWAPAIATQYAMFNARAETLSA